MAKTISELKSIDIFHDFRDLVGFEWISPNDWSFHVIRRRPDSCHSYISANRREFYKIIYATEGICILTIGLKSYYVDQPTIFFIHPNEIMTLKKLDNKSGGFVIFFKRKLADDNQSLKIILDKYALFSDTAKSAIRLSSNEVSDLDKIFEKMQELDVIHGGKFEEDTFQVYLQLLMITCTKYANYPQPETVGDDYSHIHEFFQLLEKETTNINYTTPIQVKTAQEFANKLYVHPNYLNSLLKKHTGENASTHIKKRLLEESKVLLLRTDWTLQDIGYSIGFADQPNFSQFFKKSTGMTPAEFRKRKTL